MKTGLVSVSFRALGVKEIIKVAKESSLDYIEWGGDKHVKMGKVRFANKVRKMTERAGLKCDTYGSYYGVVYHKGEHIPLSFRRVLKTARALGAKKVRIWAGWPGCTDNTEDEFNKAVLRTRAMCAEAKKFGITLALECHKDTITDDYHDTIRFIESVGCDNLKTYWQINQAKPHEYNVEAAKALLPYMTDVHVFYWKNDEKFPLSDGGDDWRDYMDILKSEDRIFFIEFMHDGKPSSLPETADTLRSFFENK